MSDERQLLECEAQEAIRSCRLALDDLSATLERLRQLRHLKDVDATLADQHLVIELGPNGRPEVCR